MAVNDIDVIGVGWAFPFEIDEDTGGVKKASGVQKVGMAIRQILGTAIGERAWLRAFGTQAHDLLFQPIDPALQNLLEHYMLDSIERWEKRVRIIEALLDISRRNDPVAARLVADINFQLLRTQKACNVVFPLYLNQDERENLSLTTG